MVESSWPSDEMQFSRLRRDSGSASAYLADSSCNEVSRFTSRRVCRSLRAAKPGIERDGRLEMGFGTVVEAKPLIGRADRPTDRRLDGGPVVELASQLGRCRVEQLAHGEAGAAD